jgi:cell division protein FtsI (penicillin-binding protein 3)
LLFVAVCVRDIYLQVVKRDQLVKIAERQYQRVVPLTPARGTIYDCNNAALAVSIDMDSCFAEPQNVEDVPGTCAKLAPLLGIPAGELAKKLDTGKHFVWLQRRITPDLAKRISDLELAGIGFVKETKRFYPNSEVAAHVIGFTGLDPEGLNGIELRYNSAILGNNGYLVTERDALGRDIGIKGAFIKNSSKGQNVTLTLDKNIQYIAEKELAKAVLDSRAKGGIAIVMEPQTGKVLAMANYPNFNLNAFNHYPQAQLRNRAITDSFEPGSTFKIFLIAAALEEKVISSGESIYCENGSYEVGGRTIHDTHPYGRLSIGGILKYSSNIGSAKIGARLGQERLSRYLRNFGFGERTGIDLPGEAPGYLRDRSQWYGVDLATISFGQGVTSSALQLTAAVSAVANGGTLMKPYIVDRIVSQDGTVTSQFAPHPVRRVISPATARSVARMMEGVTTEGGTGLNASIDGYRVAGKTGTAQKVDPVTRTYSVDKRTASFIGFAPVNNPRFTIMVVIDEPKTSPYGGVVAAPAFSAIALQSLCYRKVTPDQPVRRKDQCVTAKAEPPAATEEQAAEGTVIEGDGGEAMPNFAGMSMREVLRVMERRGINVKLIGSGSAREQNPRPGQRIGPSDQVWVRFAPAA